MFTIGVSTSPVLDLQLTCDGDEAHESVAMCSARLGVAG